MTDKKLAANRNNALNSTGPKTSIGKAVSSRNALKHGVLVTAPVLAGIESHLAWEEHREGVFKSIAPVGYMENVLALRIALVSWRLWRVVRYEAEVAAATVATAEADLENREEYGSGKPAKPATAHAKAARASLIIELLQNLPMMSNMERVDTGLAVVALWALWKQVPDGTQTISVPGIPDDDAEFDAFDHWTADLLRKAVEVYAAAARMTREALLSKAITSAYEKRAEAEDEELELVERGRQWKLRLERESRSRMLLEPDVLEKVARYESGLERSLFRTLHELQRLQAARSGAVVPPPAAVDIDLVIQRAT